jgi:hypothetical protein
MTSISVIVVAEDGLTLLDGLQQTIAALELHFEDIEIVLIANGVSNETALHLKQAVETIPDITCHFIADKVETEIAHLIGIEHAIGDCILLTDTSDVELAYVPAMVSAIHEGFDLVVVPSESPAVKQPLTYRLVRRGYHAIISALSDLEIPKNASTLRLMNRAASVYMLGQLNAEVLLRATSLSPSFPAKVLVPGYTKSARSMRPLRGSVARAFRSIVVTSSLPLRAAIFLGCIGATGSIFYSGYTFAIYFFASAVQPGWTTLSLFVSGMMLLLFIILALIAEYILQIHSRMPLQRRYNVTREVRSLLTRNEHRRNLIIESGETHIGMPEDLVSRSSHG